MSSFDTMAPADQTRTESSSTEPKTSLLTASGKPMFFAPLLTDLTRTKEEARRLVNDIPQPPRGYEFSRRQRAEQFDYFFERKDNRVLPSDLTDLYNYAIIAVCK
jgi:hypothetical protein